MSYGASVVFGALIIVYSGALNAPSSEPNAIGTPWQFGYVILSY